MLNTWHVESWESCCWIMRPNFDKVDGAYCFPSACHSYVHDITWATSWENLFLPYANNKGAYQPAHPHSLISAFVIHCLDSIISLVSSPEPLGSLVSHGPCPSVVYHFQRSSSPKPLGLSKPKFIWSLTGMGERKFVHGVWVTWPRWPPCPYIVKTLQKSSSPEPKGHWPCGLVCSIGDGPIIVCSNDDPRLTLTYFTVR